MSMSTDYFAELGRDRILSINLDSLRETFQMKAKEVHPDRGGDESDFDRLNHANSILSDPCRRIEHLYELLFASTIDSSGSLSSLATDLFGTLEPIISRADAMIKKKELATNISIGGMDQPSILIISPPPLERLAVCPVDIRNNSPKLDKKIPITPSAEA